MSIGEQTQTSAGSTLSPMQKAVVALKRLRARNAELEQAASAPIAVIGMGCRYPAGGDSPDLLWQAVEAGRDGRSEVPAARWDIEQVYDPVPGRPGRMYVRTGCFLPRVDGFDPLFFRISPREAVGIDPQQRLLLEVAWEALEDAGLPPPRLVGSSTGVYVGISTNDYSALLSRTAHGSGSNATAGAGNAASVASGRISYTFGFEGPCLAVDTACSSSLVATHLAVQALRGGECNLALVAGVNLMLTPDITINFCQGRMLSPDGRCKTFDAAADGYARGEGCGVVVLKRLAEALADGDRVLAVIRGSAINQDGRSAGLTAPNGLAQEAVIRKALKNAGVPSDAIDYIEAHGTGTALGDPIEMHALKAVFAGRSNPLHVGSVKPNIGHTEAAAGVAGLIKAVLMLQHQALPPLAHFRTLNPHIDLGDAAIHIPTELTPMPLGHVGVSSFGFSGTNVHVLLEAPPAPASRPPAAAEAGPPRLLLTARTREAVRALIARYQEHLAATTDSFQDICHTASTGRAIFPWWVCVDDPADLARATPANGKAPELPPMPGRKVALPTYPFERQRYWVDAPVVQEASVETLPAGQHPLLGRRLRLPGAKEARWEAALDLGQPALAFLAEHQVQGRCLLPAACFVEMGLTAHPGREVVDLEIAHPLEVDEAPGRLVQTIAAADGSFRIVSFRADAADLEPLTHATGRAVASNGAGEALLPSDDLGEPLADGALYQAMEHLGVRHGPSFRLLVAVRRRHGHASAELAPGEAGTGFTVHPARLDAAFQLVAAALPDMGDDLLVPARIGGVRLHRVPRAEAKVFAAAERHGGEAMADVVVTDDEGVALEIRGLCFRRAAEKAAPAPAVPFYRVEWQQRPLVQRLAAPSFLPSADRLAAALEPVSGELAARHGMAAYAQAAESLERAATRYVVAALRRLGLTFRPGAEVTFGALAESLGVAERHHRLLRRLLGMLEEDGVLKRRDRRWTVLDDPGDGPAGPGLEALVAELPELGGESQVLRRCGEALADVLTGAIEPLGLLFPTDGAGAGAFYEMSPYARTVNGLLSAAARHVAATLPRGRVLRILEIGAGTGGATGALLEAIQRPSRHYVFSDVSPSFLSGAAQRFPDEGLLTQILDIEKSPAGQDFEDGSFDLVLAANVLHATKDLRQSLAHARDLLAPGGILLLVESTAPRRWIDIVFGLTEGWWRFADTDLRPDHPLLTAERWQALLAECGFEISGGWSGDVIVARRPPTADRAEGSGLRLLGDTARLVPVKPMAASADSALRWVFALPPADVGEAGQVELMAGLAELARDAICQTPPPQLTLVADGTMDHAGAAGFVRTLAVELPQLRPRLLVAPPGPEALLDELVAGDAEAEVRWDVDGRREVPRLVPAPRPDEAIPTLTGAWLITGARGGVAQKIATWLAQHGASELILLSRHAPDRLPDMGVPVRVVEGDAADEALIPSILDAHPALEGVVHAAGVLADAPVAEQTRETIASVAHAKIGGAMALDRAIRGRDIRHIVLFASAAGVLGSARQANHAFCSTFLDGLAEKRRAEGLPYISLDWGVWREVGSAAERGFDGRAQQLGLGSIDPEQGASLFGAALRSSEGRLLVLPSVDWRRFTAHFEAGVPALLEKVARGQESPPAAAPGQPVAAAGAPGRDDLARIVGQCLGITGTIDPEAPLHELGLDSLTAVEIRNRVEKELGVTLSVRELIEGASLAALQERLGTPTGTALGERMAAVIAAVLGLGGLLDPETPLHDLGLDSLMAVEIKNRLEKEAGVQVSVRDLIEGASLRSLVEAQTGQEERPAVPAVRRIVPDLARQHEPFPLTDMQQAYWLGRRNDLELGNVSCYLYTEFDTDVVDLARAEAAWNVLIRRHGMLRMVIRPDGTQRILAEVPHYRFEVRDLRGKPAEPELDRLRRSLPRRVAEPNTWPLFDIRATLFGDTTRLHMGFDLMALDAASIHALRQEWGRLYDDPATILPPIGLSFRDVVLEERAFRETASWRRSETYWKERALTLPPGPDLPLVSDPLRRSKQRFVRHRTVLEAEEAGCLRREAQGRGITLPTLLAAVYADVLAAWSRTSHFCVTVTSFSRPPLHEDMASLLGDFTSTILLEVDARPPRFEGRAQALARQLAADLEHAAVGGVHVLREVARRKGTAAAYVPFVFTSALGFRPPGSMQADSSDASGWDRLGRTVFNVSSTPQVLIDNQISEEDGRLFCNWDVVEGMFPAGVVERMVQAYQELLHALAAGLGWDRAVGPTLPPACRPVFETVAAAGLLHAAFERQALAAPNRIALITPEAELDYGTLDAAARHLAASLLVRLNSAPRDRLVAVCFPKGWHQIVAVLAVLKAGAAYLPIDPGLPAERRRLLIERGDALVLDDPAELDAALLAAHEGRSLPDLPTVLDPQRLAYVIYTSGSTGMPKGVMIEHAAALATVAEVNRRWQVGSEDRVLGLSSLSFDLSVYDIFGPLSVGGALVLPDADAARDPSRWAEALERHGVTIWNSVPALMALQLEHGLPAGHRLRLVLLSGDWVPLDLVARLKEQAPATSLVALGGATEAAIWSNAHEVGELDPEWPSIPYGTPLAGHGLHVVNQHGGDCPDWVTGQIEIAGQGVARGYWRDLEQTAQRFYVDAQGLRRYRTGDLGRFRPYAGTADESPLPIEFLGREDFQVKVQGHRIELGEIEATLALHPAVSQAVAAVFPSADGRDRTLHAFVVPRDAAPAAGPDWDRIASTARAAVATHGQAIERRDFELTARTFTDQAAAAAAAAIRRLTGGSERIPTVDELIGTHGVAPRYRRWLMRMLPEVARVGIMATPVSTHAISGVDRFGFNANALDFVDRVIAALPDILTEREHSSAIYLSGETPDVYAKLFATPNAVLGTVLREIAAGRTVSILEVGGGLGTTLAAIEPWLPVEQVRYRFTDANGHLLRAAAERFTGRDWLSFEELDFDRPVATRAPSFDVVLASSALHVAADVGRTLRHLRSCLAPGGYLLALEQTRFFPWFDLSMGLQAGFDRRTDHELRPSHPLLSRVQWQEQLDAAGFAKVAVPTAEGTIADLLGFDVLIAQAPTGPVETMAAEPLRDHLRARLPAYMVPATISVIDRVPLSANGKVDRRALVPAVGSPWKAPDEVQASRLEHEVGEVVAGLLGLDRIDPRASLFELGATSLTLVGVQRQLAARFGRVVPLQRVFEHPNVAGLAAEIADRRAVASPLITFDAQAGLDDRRPTLVLMPGIFSLPFYLRELAAAAAGELAIVSVQLPGLADHERPLDRIEEQAGHALRQIRLAQPHGPYLIGGHSFGGLVAVEVARGLREAGEAVPLLVLGDTVRPASTFGALQTDELAYTAMTRGLLALYGRGKGMAGVEPEGVSAEERFRRTAQRMQEEGAFGALTLPLDRMVGIFKANFRAMGSYRPAPVPGNLTLIRTEGGFPPEFLEHGGAEVLADPALGWSGRVEGAIDVRTMPGDHLSLLDAAHLPVMADLLTELVREALARHAAESCDTIPPADRSAAVMVTGVAS